jgi:hypothetical protein
MALHSVGRIPSAFRINRTNGLLKKSLHDFFSTRNAKSAVFALLPFQTFAVFENAGTSMCRTQFVENRCFSTNC